MASTAATVERATSLFQTALLYTISSAAITSLIETANSSYIPIVVIAAFGGIGVAIHALGQLGDGTQDTPATAELFQLLRHLLALSVDVLVQLASNGVGRLVLFAFMGSASLLSTVLGVVVSIILLWALKQSAEL
jgi:hypothetical protein